MTEATEAHKAGDTDAALLALLADDLDAGFVDLMRAHGRVLYSVALSVTGRRVEAEDLAAEAFLRAYRGLREFDGIRIASLKVRPWLVTILLNTWRNWLRDSRRRPHEVPLERATDAPRHTPDTDELAELDEQRRELVAMIRILPDHQRISVVLRHVAGLPIAEVAAVLGCPEGTAKSHISRGLRRLRKLYEERREIS